MQSVVRGGGTRGVASPAAALGVQPKLQINTPGDRYEQEADAVASAVTSGTPAPTISTLPPGGLASGAPSSGPSAGVSAQRETADDEPAQMTSEEEAEPVQMADEEENVQMQALEGEEEPAQRMEEEESVQMKEQEEPAQMQELEDESAQMQELEEDAAQAKAAPGGSAGGGRSTSAAAAASRAMSQTGAGSPLPSPVRSRIEGSTGRDFSGVRVHDGAAAQTAARAINAKAFTRGDDIYLGRGASPTDTQLMAHEATHVVQQSAAPPATSSAQRQPAQRQETEDEPVQMQETEEPVQRAEGDASNEAADTGEMDEEAGEIRFREIEIPAFKNEAHRGTIYSSRELRRKGPYDRGNPNQRNGVWIPRISTGQIEQKLQDKVSDQYGDREDPRGGSYVFDVYGQNRYLMGDISTIARELVIPTWGKDGDDIAFQNNFHVDHILELQLSGWDGSEPVFANSLENMELLEGSANMASGRIIRANLAAKADDFAEATENQYGTGGQILNQYDLVFDQARGSGGPDVGEKDFWTPSAIERGEHLDHEDAVRPANFTNLGEAGTILIFPGESGGTAKGFSWTDEETAAREPSDTNETNWLKPFEITELFFNTQNRASDEEGESGRLGYFKLKVPEESKTFKGHEGEIVELSVYRVPGATYAGYVNKSAVRRTVQDRLNVRDASPVRVDRFDIDPETGLIVEGKLLPTVPLIRDADIDVILRDGDLSISKTFQVGDYNFPGPVAVTQSNLTLAFGTERGLSLSGRADLEIEDVGTGHLEGGASTAVGFHVAGGFDFDTELFTEASIDLGYHKAPDEEAVFTGEGTLAIGRDKVKGIKSASIDVTVENESWTADGTVEPEINGIREGTLTAAYAPETGFAIDGSLTLSEEVPGIRGGTLEAGVRKRESGDGYKIRASGDADLDIPGVSSRIGVTYDDGLFTAQTTVGYERGMLSGSLTVGVTNQPLGDDGQPASGEDAADPSADLRAFGGGSMTLGLAPWLQATAGVQLLPNGEVEMRGEIGIPSTIELFPERTYERRLFQIGIDIPIVGVAVAGQRIGIFATVNGGLDATASIGPGELRDANLAVEYNPDREEETTITGHALFVIPAFAGLRLFVRGGLGAGIPIVSAEAGLEVGGQIGLSGAAEAEADVNWNPQAGLALHAEGRIFAEPSFLFDVSGYANVSADLVFTSIDLYDERFTLASYEWGSGMRVGVIFPVDYREGEPFSLSTDDIEFVYPEINPRAIITDLVDEVV